MAEPDWRLDMPERICSIDGCEKPAHARGWCSVHYGMWRHYGDPLYQRPRLTGVPCSIEGCDRPAKGRGWCGTHWLCWKRHGDPEYIAPIYTHCTVVGCENVARNPRASLCEMHYCRQWRTGSLELEPAAGPWVCAYCSDCGEPFIVSNRHAGARGARFCSLTCKHRHDARTYSRRVRSAPERERISRAMLAERDGWRCHICKRKVTRKTWSVDHLVPLSVGGTHTWDNVALAHKNCNSARGWRGEAQLLLMG